MSRLIYQQRSALSEIFRNPVRANLEWTDIESLLRAPGGEISEGTGSRVRIYLNGVRAVIHRPHPASPTDKGAIKSARRFLMEAGIDHAEI
ncbi:MAG TPA: type II toxin-antitoxin system HicA family toxin [bacterium]|nr:type II toxin-antitoxin system HicA family toxin [bacterium]HPR87691.1 type II toxin-antitoxin system HicA family toxin [bacterium]